MASLISKATRPLFSLGETSVAIILIALYLLMGSARPAQADAPAHTPEVSLVAARAASTKAAWPPGPVPTSVSLTATDSAEGERRITKEVRQQASEMIAGFRMESAPQVSAVFGDIAAYKTHLLRFSNLRKSMNEQRQQFATAAHRIQRVLGQVSGKRKRASRRNHCPINKLSQDVTTAVRAQRRFSLMGRELQVVFTTISQLHTLGESSGLTPDYRARVLESKSSFRQALLDLSEMNSVMRRQIDPELLVRGCKKEELLRLTNSSKKASSKKGTPRQREVSPLKAPKQRHPPSVVQARLATFFVDNQSCSDHLNIYVDSTLLGGVEAGSSAAFQGLSGQHTICLIPQGDSATCGDTGTVRSAFLHDGFRIRRSCDASSPHD